MSHNSSYANEIRALQQSLDSLRGAKIVLSQIDVRDANAVRSTCAKGFVTLRAIRTLSSPLLCRNGILQTGSNGRIGWESAGTRVLLQE